MRGLCQKTFLAERGISIKRSCSACQIAVFLPNSLATGQAVMLHAGQVEIVAIVMPLIFGQSLLIVILCGYFTKSFEILVHLNLCVVVLL